VDQVDVLWHIVIACLIATFPAFGCVVFVWNYLYIRNYQAAKSRAESSQKGSHRSWSTSHMAHQ